MVVARILLITCILFVSLIVADNIPVLTQNYNNARTGTNVNETILTPTIVKSKFAPLFTLSLDADVAGQILYVPNLNPNLNVIFCWTSDNYDGSPAGIWAFNADVSGSALWYSKLPQQARFTTDSPAIDLQNKVMYFVSKNTDDQGPNYLHAINIMTGQELPNSPIQIVGSVKGTGAGSINGYIHFEDAAQNCRPGMLLLDGIVYLGFAFNTDEGNYHGWAFGYQYDYNSKNFIQKYIWNASPNGTPGGGIWQAGKGLVSDGTYIYFSTGNGPFDTPIGSYGMTVMKMDKQLNVIDWFSPAHESIYSDEDADLGNCGPLFIPNTNLLFIGSTKYGQGYLINSTNLGHHSSTINTCIQTLVMTGEFIVGQNPIVFQASSQYAYVYLWAKGTVLQQYRFDYSKNLFNPSQPYKQVTTLAGGSLTVSSNGQSNGILWTAGYDGKVRAYDANDITQPLLYSASIGSVGHFQFPVVVNGKLFVGTGNNKIVVFGSQS